MKCVRRSCAHAADLGQGRDVGGADGAHQVADGQAGKNGQRHLGAHALHGKQGLEHAALFRVGETEKLERPVLHVWV
jgi:hypothetical protein